MLKNTTRRELLKGAGALAATIAAPSVLHAATKETKGIDASRVGLVIGNSKYTDSPLSNPVNDANAIAQLSEVMGFKTQCLLNASLKDISAAVEAYVDELQRQKAVGFFYYAGHGVQLGWRNYIVPIGANIDRLDDVPKQAYELNIMLAALTKAKNPMNIIILDACRDNPFGKRVLPEQKGLSQFDAPIGSLLSYATSPGNTASDGSGANGLFTENLLREMKVPLTRIEDVFKRVRLNVRLQSKGGQIPWESTSLEDDFYFIADEAQFKQAEHELILAKEKAEADALAKLQAKVKADSNSQALAKALAEAEAQARMQAEADAKERARIEAEFKSRLSFENESTEKKFKEELALWEKAVASPSVEATEAYLKQYPSGLYAELASVRLDILLAKAGEKKLIVQSTDNNPFTEGTVSGVSRFTLGDQFTYVEKDALTGVANRTFTEVVTSLSETQIEINSGMKVLDILGNELRTPRFDWRTPAQIFPSSYSVGQSWKTTFKWAHSVYSKGQPVEQSQSLKVVGRERIVTPAGSFNAFKIVGAGYQVNNGGNERIDVTLLIDPEKCSRPIMFELRIKQAAYLRMFVATRTELTAFKQRAMN